MDALHRIVTGAPLRRSELIAAGCVAVLWLAIDIVQFSDWVWQKFNPPQTAICLPVSSPPAAAGYYCGSHDCSIPLPHYRVPQDNGVPPLAK